MLTITKCFEFEACHHLPEHPGKCKNMHGHSYKLEVEVTGTPDTTGMIIDFGDLKKAVQTLIIDLFDHRDLNIYFETPTAENMVVWIVNLLEKENIPVVRVRLWETSTSYAEWKL